MTHSLATVETLPMRLSLQLEVTDPEIVAILRTHAEGDERAGFALSALRVGVLSLRAASGLVDADTIREAGSKLLADVRELLAGRGTEITNGVASSLAQYLDPKSG